MTNIELAELARTLANDYKTLYVEGAFGAPLNAVNRVRYVRNNAYNARPERAARIMESTSSTYAFSNTGLVTGLYWGWDGSNETNNGGAGYAINGIPDGNAITIMNHCLDVKDTMDGIMPGEVVRAALKMGIYVGNGEVVVCDAKEADGVQITGMEGLSGKQPWEQRGKLPEVSYVGG